MAKKKYTYSPVAPYNKLKNAELAIQTSGTVEDLVNAMQEHGPKIGYKAFCYLAMEKMTSEAMKPDEAAVAALELAQEGDVEAATEIFAKILEWHPDHSVAKGQIEMLQSREDDGLPEWINAFELD